MKFAKSRVLSLLVAGSMLLSTIFPAVLLAETSRTGGSDRFTTAVEVAKKGWPNGAENVVMVNAYAPSDAAVAGPLADKLDAPVLLTDGQTLSQETQDEILSLGAKNVVLIGGTGVISSQIEINLTSKYSVKRYAGDDRYDTAAQIAAVIGYSSKVVLVSGEGQMDALAVASWAAANDAPILYTKKDVLPTSTKNAIQQAKANSAVVIGGEGVISKQVYDTLPNPQRYGGKDRFETATVLATALYPNAENIFVATGLDFADAMVGVGLAAKAKAPILYLDKAIPDSLEAYLVGSKGKLKNVNLLGGKGVVTELQTSVMLRMAGLEADDTNKTVFDAVKSYFATRSNFITADDFNKALTEKPNENLVLDIRQPDVYAKSHIKGAINVPYNNSFGENIDKIRAAAQGKTVTVACYTGQTAGQVASLLNVAGIKAQSLLYGMGTTGFNFGWITKGFPVVAEPTLMPELTAVLSPSPVIDQAIKNYFVALKANNQIKAPELRTALSTNPEDYLILDIRGKADFDEVHIKGAVNVPWGSGEIGTKLEQIQKDALGKTVVVICYTGQSAGKTTSLLNLIGIKAKALAFGMGDHRPGFDKGWVYEKYETTDTVSEQVYNAVESYFVNIPTDIYKIGLPVLKAALDANTKEYVVLDIRQKDAYDKGHIQGAINVPYGSAIAENLDKIRALAKDKTLVVACYTGQTAGQTDSLLNIAGIKTRSLDFGMGMDGFEKGWMAQAGYPVVTEATSMPSDLPVVQIPNPAIDELVKKYFNPMPKDSYKIGLPEANAVLEASPDQYLVVDIRRATDYAAGHIKGAINVPFGAEIGKNLAMLKEKAQGKTMIVYCYTGQTAGQTDSLMNLIGIPTKSLNFGFGTTGFSKGWKTTGYEIVK